MTAPIQRSGGLDANARGLAVLAVAVVVGLLLLLTTGGDSGTTQVAADGNGGSPTTIDISGIDDTEADGEVTTTTPDQTTTSSSTPTDGLRDPGEVKVLVLNGSGLGGVARSTSETIGEKGYVMQPATNSTNSPNQVETAVYFADGYQAEAEAVAAVIGKAPDVVEAMPSTPPGAGADSANVVVVLGKDTAPAESSTTTTAN
ncbi:MAG TPA: LytR C-terminal domain-containing protein [Acidimicrobiales bacterium]|jgi:hypothetical protein|nr:LytR C-terminal domain-containing protein [Acidimicrobiales bacterium]HMS87400.1 LytR C-terminal domain-containing protein [Acidimicrobiales bacterium]HRA35287.1 LytR C-terminal domain-containing protein [Acidimicrobiales bacterium]